MKKVTKRLQVSTLSLLLFSLPIQAESDLERLYRYYNAKSYQKACNLGLRLFGKYKKNGDFLMLYGFSCLKADYIDRLAVPMTGLRKTKTERANASYFATVILQKKLLYHALVDHVDISQLRLPRTDYILSEVFDMYTHNNYTKREGKLYFRPDNGKVYTLYLVRSGPSPKMVIEEWEGETLIKTHTYW